MAADLFPVMVSSYKSEAIDDARKAGIMNLWLSVPWSVVAPHEAQAQRNHDQSLRMLASRGGLSACELVAVLEDRPWHRMSLKDAYEVLDACVRTAIEAEAKALCTPPPAAL